MNSLNALLAELQGEPDKYREIRQTIRQFFHDMWQEAGCTITPEILRYADMAYDAPVTDILADALGTNLYDLRYRLGRDVVMECQNCNEQFLVRELRVKNGYSVSGQNSDLCDKCKRDVQKEQSRIWKERREDALAVHQQRVAVDKLILKSPDDPRTMQAIKPHLLEILTYWLNPARSFLEEYKPGCGCMMCNHQPVGIFLIADKVIYQPNGDTTTTSRLADNWLEYGHQYNHLETEKHPWPPLQYPLQLIWRLEPHRLFRQVFLMPVKELPILFLCDECISIAELTHYEPYPGERWSIKH